MQVWPVAIGGYTEEFYSFIILDGMKDHQKHDCTSVTCKQFLLVFSPQPYHSIVSNILDMNRTNQFWVVLQVLRSLCTTFVRILYWLTDNQKHLFNEWTVSKLRLCGVCSDFSSVLCTHNARILTIPDLNEPSMVVQIQRWGTCRQYSWLNDQYRKEILSRKLTALLWTPYAVLEKTSWLQILWKGLALCTTGTSNPQHRWLKLLGLK